MTRRRWVRVLVAVPLAVLAWAFVSALLARNDVARARDRITALRDEGGDADDVAAALGESARDLRSARDTLRQPAPRLVANVPLLGRSFRALSAVDASALTVVEAARDVLAEVRSAPLVDGGHIELSRLESLSEALRTAADRTDAVPGELARLRTGWSFAGGGVADARAQLGGVPSGLRRSADLLDALAGVLGGGGERRILVVLENNAELRGSGGLVSVFAEATAKDGRVSLERFRDVADVAQQRGSTRAVPAPQDYVARYGRFLANTTLWRNANMSPDVPTSSRVLAELAAVSLRHRPDAVITLDVPAVARILGATGHVNLSDGRTLDEDNAVEELLSKAYAGVPDTHAGQDERRRRLRVAADAVVRRLFSGDAPTVALGAALGDAAAGRHLAVWSARPEEQRAIVAAGAGGAVRDDTTDLAMASIQNFGGGRGEGNKLDYYARLSVAVKVRVTRTEAVTERTYRLRNESPTSGLPGYVAGLERPGQSRSFVSFALPSAAAGLEVVRDGNVLAVTPQPEGGHVVVDDFAALDPGGEAVWTVRYRTPLRGRAYSLRVVPQPLAHDATLSLDVAPAGGAFFDGVRDDGPFATERRVTVNPRAGRWWERAGRSVRNFWTRPVLS